MDHTLLSLDPFVMQVTKISGNGNFYALLGILIWFYYAFVRRQRRGWRQASVLLQTAMRLREAGHKDLSTEVLCSLAWTHPRFAMRDLVESLLQDQLENPAHRASLLLAYKAMHDQFPEDAGLSYKLAHLYHLDGRDGDALALLNQSLSGTTDTVHWKARMSELRDKLQTMPEDAKPTDTDESATGEESTP